MKTRIKKLSIIGLIICMIAVILPLDPLQAYAASGKISFSDPSAAVGEAVSVTMKVEASDGSLGSIDIMLNYDPALLEFTGGSSSNGGAGSIKVVSFASSANDKLLSFQLNFKVLQAGTSKISVASQEIYSFNEEVMNMAKIGNSTVTVKAPSNASNDAALSELAVAPGTLSPAFSPNVTSYTASVGAKDDKVVVGASVNQGGAKLTISGNTNLKAGSNKVTVKVTAEDKQTVKTYTITITKPAGAEETTAAETTTEGENETETPSFEAVTVVVNEVNYQISGLPETVEIPEGFESTSYNYKDNMVAGFKRTAGELHLFYLVEENGEGGFFVYDEDQDRFYPYRSVAFGAKILTILPFEENQTMPKGYSIESKIKIGEQDVDVWISGVDTEDDFCLFYAMNAQGEKSLYRYDLKDETAQRYINLEVSEVGAAGSEELVDLQMAYNKLIDSYNKLIIITWIVGILGLILIVIIVSLITLKKKNIRGYEEVDEEDEIEEIEESDSDHGNIAFMPLKSNQPAKEEKVKSDEPDSIDELTKLLKNLSDNPQAKDTNSEIPSGEKSESDEDFEFFDLDDEDE